MTLGNRIVIFVQQSPVGRISHWSGRGIIVFKDVFEYLVRHGGHIGGGQGGDGEEERD